MTARDRGWQIEVDRWRAEGRLAERSAPTGSSGTGSPAGPARGHGAAGLRALADEDRAFVDAYVDGVNAGRDGQPLDAELAGDAVRAVARWAPLGIMLVAPRLFSVFPRLLVERARAR